MWLDSFDKLTWAPVNEVKSAIHDLNIAKLLQIDWLVHTGQLYDAIVDFGRSLESLPRDNLSDWRLWTTKAV